MKIYQNLSEALEDINWQGKGHRSTLKVAHNKNCRDIRKREVTDFFNQEFSYWIDFQSRLPYTHKDKYVEDVKRVLWELIENAEYESGQGQSFTAEIYVGNNGCLLGTIQQGRFLADCEIELLTRWQSPINSTKTRQHDEGAGTQFIIEKAKGILVLKKKKSIHVSM